MAAVDGGGGGNGSEKRPKNGENKTGGNAKSTAGRLPVVGGCRPYMRFLAEMNEKLENDDILSESELGRLWHDWLWATDPNEKISEECGGLNAMHLRGLLLCRAVAQAHAKQVSAQDAGTESGDAESDPLAEYSIVDILPETDDVHVYDKAVLELSAREFRDTLEAIQLHLLRIIERDGVAALRIMLYRLWIRLGVLAGHAFGEDVMDDATCMTNIPGETPHQVLFILTCKGIRTHVGVFLVLFRAVEIYDRAVSIDVCEDDNGVDVGQGRFLDRVGKMYVEAVKEMVKPFHVEASLDMFNLLQQLFFLAPGQQLVYRHNFSGMFNDISQVTYFHYPEYVRSPQVAAHEMHLHAQNAIPCIHCIIPQVPVVYDDGNGLPFGAVKPSEWFWLVSLGRVYLWDARQQRLIKSKGPGIMDLAAFYMLAKHGMDFFNSKDREDEEDASMGLSVGTRVKMTDFGHARLLKRKQ